jgi:beta-glucanase (GH16 family)
MRLHQVVAYSIPIVVLAVVAAVALHDRPQPAGTATSATAPATRPARTALTTPKTVAPPRGQPAFSATFTGKGLDTSVWTTCYPEFTSAMGAQGGCRNFGNAEEAEWYLPSQDKVYGGVLHLVAQRLPAQGTSSLNGSSEEYGCRSGMITSFPRLKFRYGFIQVVAKVPHSPGLWPALWLAAANGAYPPEIDMIESWGVNKLAASYLHPLPLGTYRDRGLIPVSMTTGWQTYSLSWTKSKLIYYTGNQVILTVTRNVPHQAMYFLANVAEYLPPRGGNCNGEMLIRSVKLWRN